MDLLVSTQHSGTHGLVLEHSTSNGALASDPYVTLVLEESSVVSPSQDPENNLRRIGIRRPLRQTTATRENRPK